MAYDLDKYALANSKLDEHKLNSFGLSTVSEAIDAIMYDQCSGADNTVIQGRTPDTVGTGTWTSVPSGSTGIACDGTGKFKRGTAAGNQYSYYDVGTDTCTITCDITIGTWTSMLVRYSDVSNHWDVGLFTAGLYIRERTGGTATTRASTARSYTDGATYAVTIVLTGTNIEVTADGTTVSYASASKAGNTNMGIVPLSSASGHRWANIKVVE